MITDSCVAFSLPPEGPYNTLGGHSGQNSRHDGGLQHLWLDPPTVQSGMGHTGLKEQSAAWDTDHG